MANVKKIIAENKHRIEPKKKTVEEVAQWLVNEVGAKEVPLSVIEAQSNHPWFFLENIRLNYGELEKPDIHAFVLARTDRTEKYFDDEEWEKDIWVLMETESEWTEVCMSNQLIREITLQFGITQEDYDEESVDFLQYAMAFLDIRP